MSRTLIYNSNDRVWRESKIHELFGMMRVVHYFPILSVLLLVALSSSSTAFHSIVGKISSARSVWENTLKLKGQLQSSPLSSDSVMHFDMKRALKNGSVPEIDRRYLINGWRWHTSSVVKDLHRYLDIIRLTSALSDEDVVDSGATHRVTRIAACYNFVCGFNWKGLMKVERELFFPWLEELLPSNAKPLFDNIRAQHDLINQLTSLLKSEIQYAENVVSSLSTTDPRSSQMKITRSISSTSISSGSLSSPESSSAPVEVRRSAPVPLATSMASTGIAKDVRSSLQSMDAIVMRMKASAEAIQEVQETVFVPYIAAYVPAREQEAFNRKVIARLGPINSQVPHTPSPLQYTHPLR